MRQHTPGGPARRSFAVVRRCLGRCLLGALVGCRSAAVPFTAEPGAPVPPRQVVLAYQLVEDSARELARHPLRSAWHGLGETAEHLTALTLGETGKRLVLPLRDAPPPPVDGPPPPDSGRLEQDLRQLTGRDLRPAHVTLYSTDPAAGIGIVDEAELAERAPALSEAEQEQVRRAMSFP